MRTTLHNANDTCIASWIKPSRLLAQLLNQVCNYRADSVIGRRRGGNRMNQIVDLNLTEEALAFNLIQTI
jgi:hypothetical protein